MTSKLRRDGAPPVAARRTDHPWFRQEVHGEALEDPLSWLRDRDDPAVLDLLRSENRYTEGVMAETAALQDELYGEMVARIEEDDVGVPVRFGRHWYYERRQAGGQHAIHCRRPAGDGVDLDHSYDPEAPEQVLLDLDAVRRSEGLAYLRLGTLRPSPCGSLLAYSLDTTGDERFEIRVLDLETGDHLPDRLVGASVSLAWGGGPAPADWVLYYVTRDQAQRPHRVHRHRLGTDPATDELILYEDDERFFLGLRRSRSGRYIFVTSGSHTTSEVRILDAQDPEAVIQPLTGRIQGVEFEVDHHPGDGTRPGVFYLLTNLDALEFRLVQAPETHPSPERWLDVVPHDPNVHLEGLTVFLGHLVLRRRVQGLPSIRVFRLDPDSGEVEGSPEDLAFDDEAHDVQVGSHPEFETKILRLDYQNQVTPPTTLDIDLATWERTRRKIERVHGYDPSLYVSHRLFAKSEDGVEIPVDVVQRKDRRESGPLLLYGYGAYGHSTEARFHRNIVSLLDRGWAFAIAHVRGGGELGKAWHEAGRVEHKENSFRDFVAAAEMLIAQKLTTSRQLAIRGGSAGGMLVGAVLNLRPDLCHAAIADVPFVDVLHTMLDPTLPLTVIEFEEWGNPADDIDVFRRLRDYSPCLAVRAEAYPHLLVTAGLNDPRVQYWEPAKWVQILREKAAKGGRTLLRVDLEAGHGGASGRYESLRQEAFRQAFLLAALETPAHPINSPAVSPAGPR